MSAAYGTRAAKVFGLTVRRSRGVQSTNVVEAGCFLEKIGGSKKEKYCFEQKTAWSRRALMLFKLHEIDKLILWKIVKIIATRYHI